MYIQAGTAFANSPFGVRFATTLPPPDNDNFADAIPITSVPVTLTAALTNAARQAGEPTTCGFPGVGSVWYRYTAASATTLLVSQRSVGEVQLGAFVGETIDALTLTSCWLGTPRNGVKAAVAAGETVFIRAIGFQPVALEFETLPTPPNDQPASAEEIGSLPFSADADLAGATMDPEEAASCGLDSVWYRFTAPNDLAIQASVSPSDNSSFRTRIAAYTGASPDGLTQIACEPSSSIGFRVRAGDTF